MPGLILNLKPWETFLVGGHVLQNGGRRSQIRVRDEGAGILRLSDALHPDEVRTPLTRAYYTAQLLLLGEATASITPVMLRALLEEARGALEETRAIAEALEHAASGEYYRVLRCLKPLLPGEALLLAAQNPGEVHNPRVLTDTTC